MSVLEPVFLMKRDSRHQQKKRADSCVEVMWCWRMLASTATIRVQLIVWLASIALSVGKHREWAALLHAALLLPLSVVKAATLGGLGSPVGGVALPCLPRGSRRPRSRHRCCARLREHQSVMRVCCTILMASYVKMRRQTPRLGRDGAFARGTLSSTSLSCFILPSACCRSSLSQGPLLRRRSTCCAFRMLGWPGSPCHAMYDTVFRDLATTAFLRRQPSGLYVSPLGRLYVDCG